MSKRKWLAYIPIIIMLTGLLLHSSILLWIRKCLPLETVSYETNPEPYEMMFTLSKIAAGIYDSLIYYFTISCVIVECVFFMKWESVSFRKLFFSLFLFVIAILCCVLPFSMIDPGYSGNYEYPLKLVFLKVAIHFLILLFLNYYKRKKCENRR